MVEHKGVDQEHHFVKKDGSMDFFYTWVFRKDGGNKALHSISGYKTVIYQQNIFWLINLCSRGNNV